MKRSHLILLIIVGTLLFSCRRADEPNKIIDGQIVDTGETIVPAEATQAMLLLTRDCLKTIVPVINRLIYTGVTFPELTPTGGSQFTFSVANPHYQTATFTVQFFNGGTAIDPIQTRSSTNTLTSVTLNTTGNSPAFNYSESLTLFLEVAGNPQSAKTVTGTANFAGSGINLGFTFPNPAGTNFEGLFNGQLTGTGTGPGPSNTTIILGISTDHTTDGTIAWEGKEGTMHINDNGSGFVMSNQTRFLID